MATEAASLNSVGVITNRFHGGILFDSVVRTYIRTVVDLKFETFFHPHVEQFIRGLNRKGIPGLLNLANQTLGNPYLHSPWNTSLHDISMIATGPGCMIESGFGKNTQNFRPGNLEAVVLEGKNLLHYWRDSSDVTKPWWPTERITNQATGPGCIIERLSTRTLTQPGNFEVVVLQGEYLHHYTRDNVDAAKPWRPQGAFPDKVSGPGCIIESDFKVGSNHQLEAIVLVEGNKLVHYRRDDGTRMWIKQGRPITDKATDAGCIIQSSFTSGGHGNFEVVVLEGKNLVHYSKDHMKNEWRKVAVITDSATSPGWIIQSRIQDSQLHGNFEVIVCEGRQLVHYWKDNSDLASPWRRGQVISTKATGPGCIIHGPFGIIGNFEVVVPEENGSLVHYWNVNEGPSGSKGERFYFSKKYKPSKYVDDPYPRHDVAFSFGAAYSLYNWEIFFHVPMLLAAQLSRNQRFSDAMRWYHYIFDPTDDSHELSTRRYWKFLPFRDVQKQRIDHMLEILGDPSKRGSTERQKIEDQLDDWAKHPFQPHRIARMRLISYQKNVVMKYIDNLISWGDQLFRRDTIESINEATQLYIMAANLLGPKPQRVPKRAKAKPQTYAQLRSNLAEFGIAKQTVENEFPFASATASVVRASDEAIGLLGMCDTLYFCIPQNDKLLGYWDTVADRLFNIRHCMNIEGIVRQLPLFEPPIDPSLLVKAAAKGVDLGSVLSDLSTPLPYYRFRYLLGKSFEVCSELKSLGSSLLAALEKRDAEALAVVRAKHETEILKLIRLVKEQQYDEANAEKTSVESSRKVAVTRYMHYQTLLGVEGPQEPPRDQTIQDYVPSGNYKLEEGEEGAKLTSQEKNELFHEGEALGDQERSAYMEILASLTHYVPKFGGDIHPFGVGLHVEFGGDHIAPALSAIAREMQRRSAKHSFESSKSAKLGSFVLREREWALQNNLAAKEIMQIDKQLAVADLRIAISKYELDNHDKQIEQARFIEEYLREKYTNEELYNWMQGEISAIYFQCYQLAYDLAKRAERCYRFERGVTDSNFIQFGYWDSLHKGLLSGERLYLALKQTERSYEDHDKREYEITKNFSVMIHSPQALIRLKEIGHCIIEIPEALFDADYPGHYMRRIKNVSMTIPCVVGPYTSINCTLTLLSNKIRISNNAQMEYPEQSEDDSRFLTNFATMQSIATSHGQNDSGMFELNFRDERYLPFEGAGIISRWRIEMPKENNAFDYNTISDVILTISYTAREGGDLLGQKARDATFVSPQENLVRLFSARHEFPNEWHRFLHTRAEDSDSDEITQTLQLDLNMERFPFQLQGKEIQIEQVELYLNFKDDRDNEVYQDGQTLAISLASENATASGSLRNNPTLGGIPYLLLDNFQTQIPDSIKLIVKENDVKNIAPSLRETIESHQRLKVDKIDDIFIVLRYSAH